ncbi:histidine ammonia-lyase [Hydrogenophaga sp. T4]|nr:histidine ammonia-lyase [Hydrogenophaga sp. T4]
MTHTLTLQPGQMTLADLRTVWQQAVRVQLSDDAQAGIAASAAAIHAIVHKGDAATASTPASASSPRRASPTTSWNCCSAT